MSDERGYGIEVMDLLTRYDSEHPETLGEMADRRIIYARRITEAVIRETAQLVMDVGRDTTITALADAETRGYKRGLVQGLQIAEQYTHADLSALIEAIAEGS